MPPVNPNVYYLLCEPTRWSLPITSRLLPVQLSHSNANQVARDKCPAPSLTEMQKAELHSRLSDHLACPNDVLPWSEVKAAALAKIRE